MSSPPSPLPAFVYKIIPDDPRYTVFAAQLPVPPSEVLALSAIDAKDGFIHLSTATQVPATLQRFFVNDGKVGLIKVKYDRLSAFKIVKWESASAGIFPHLYGQLEGEFVTDVKFLERTKEEDWAAACNRLMDERWLV